MKRSYLVRFDEGREPVYAFVRARSKTEIYIRLPELRVLDRPPGWMKPERVEEIERHGTLDIDEEPGAVVEPLRRRSP